MRNRIIAAVLAFIIGAQPVMAAVSCSVLTASSSTTNATSHTTASVTPGADRLILVATAQTRSAATACTDNDVTGITGNGLTWVHINRQCFSDAGSPTNTVELWRSMGSSPSSGAVVFDFSGTTQLNAAWAVIECTGTDTSGTNGSGAVVQSVINKAEPGTSLTATLGAFGSAGNATLGVFANSTNQAITEGSGFTELTEQQVSEGLTLQVEWKSTNDTSVDASFSSIDAGAVAIEIKASAAAADTSGNAIWFP